MKPQYAEYLDALIEQERKYSHHGTDLPRSWLLRNKCSYFTQKFVEKFPNLKRQAGFYGEIEHWWCVDENGEIVDPTREQFCFDFEYTLYDVNTHEVYLGKCMNCGDEIYGLACKGSQCVCSKECEKILSNYYNELMNKVELH